MTLLRSLVLVFVLYGVGLWGMSVPLTGDQKTYLSIALEMREKGEWVTPHLFGAANFLKPPLQYWATLLGWNIFGFGLWGALIPSLLALLGTMVALGRISQHFFSHSKTSSLPGLVFAATLGTMTYATTAQMEIWIVLFYLWAWVFLLERKILRAWILVGLMALIKGPLYSALCGASFLWFEKSNLKNIRHLAGCALGVVSGLAWFFLAARTHQNEIMSVFFLQENLQKIGGNRGSPFSLWGEFIYSLLPVLIYLIHVSVSTGKNFYQQVQHNGFGRWIICFGLLPAVFFTFFPYRVNTYLFILTPIFALVLSRLSEVVDLKSSVRPRLLSTGFVLSFCVAVSLMVLLYRLSAGHWVAPAVAAVLAIILVIWVWFHYRQHALGVVLISICMVNLIRIAAVGLGEHDLYGLRHYLETNQVTEVAYRIEDRDIWHEYGLISAAIGKPIQRVYNVESENNFLRLGGVLILQPDQVLPVLSQNEKVKCDPWVRFRKRMKFPIKELLLSGLSVEDDRVIRSMQLCRHDVSEGLSK